MVDPSRSTRYTTQFENIGTESLIVRSIMDHADNLTIQHRGTPMQRTVIEAKQSNEVS